MPSEPKVYYWDACVLLSAVEGTPDRLPVIEAVLAECAEKKVEIYTSHLSMTEVAFAKAEKDGCVLDEDTEAKIDTLWHPESVIRTVEIHELITRNAKDLMRQMVPRGYSLKPGDAIHLVTAKYAKAVEFHTYDHKLFKYEDYLGFKIGHPHIEQVSMFPTPGSPLRNLRRQQVYWRAYPVDRDERRERHRFLPSRDHRIRMKNHVRNRASVL